MGRAPSSRSSTIAFSRSRFALCVAALAGSLALAGAPEARAQEGVRVTAGSLVVRTGPDLTYAELGTVAEGQIYVATSSTGSWVEIWYNRNRGWVHSDHVAPCSTTYDAVSRGTNVRTGPSSSWPKIGYAVSGSMWAVVDVSSSGSWHEIFYEGRLAWFYANGRASTAELIAPDEPVSVAADLAVRIAGDDTFVRSGPGVGWDTIGTARAGQIYFSTESFAGWRKIWFSRSQGWLPDPELALESSEFDTVNWDWLNVRTGPGLEYAKVTSVPAGSKWVNRGYSGSWHEIDFDGETRWFSGLGVTTEDYVAPDGAEPSPTSSTVGFLKLPASGPGFVRRCGANNPDHAWGAPTTINGLLLAAESWSLAHPEGPRIRVGDLSLPDGGVFDDNGSSHLTHQSGTDIDIFLLRLDGSDDGAPSVQDPSYSSALTRDWIENHLTLALPAISTHGILLADPALFSKLTTISSIAVCPGEGCPLEADGSHVAPGPDALPYVMCNPGHDDHMHVRTEQP